MTKLEQGIRTALIETGRICESYRTMILDKTVERNGQSDWAKIEVAAWKPCKKNPTVFFSLRVNIVKALIYWDMSTAQEVSTEDGGRILREYTA